MFRGRSERRDNDNGLLSLWALVCVCVWWWFFFRAMNSMISYMRVFTDFISLHFMQFSLIFSLPFLIHFNFSFALFSAFSFDYYYHFSVFANEIFFPGSLSLFLQVRTHLMVSDRLLFGGMAMTLNHRFHWIFSIVILNTVDIIIIKYTKRESVTKSSIIRWRRLHCYCYASFRLLKAFSFGLVHTPPLPLSPHNEWTMKKQSGIPIHMHSTHIHTNKKSKNKISFQT